MIFNKIKYKTTLFFLLTGTIPTLLIAIYILFNIRNDATEKIYELQSNNIKIFKNIVADKLKDYEKQLKSLANNMDIQSLEYDKLERSITHFLDSNDFFSTIFVFDKDGKLLIPLYKNKSKGEFNLIGMNFLANSNKEHLKTKTALKLAIEKRELIRLQWNEFERQQTYLQILVPIFAFEDPEELIGILSARVSLYSTELASLIDFFHLSGKQYLFISDFEGNVFISMGDTSNAHLKKIRFYETGKNSDQNILQKSGSGIFNINGRDDLISFEKLEDFNLMIIFGIPNEEVLYFIQNIFRSVLILLIVAIILAFFLGIYLSKNLTDPILELIKGINKVGAGAISHRIKLKRRDELGAASEAFNKMASNLQKNKILEETWLRKWNKD